MNKLTQQQVEEIRQARRLGATITALASQYRVLPTTIAYHCQDIVPEGNGRNIAWVPLEELLAWLPALPWQGVPLPMWVVKAAKLDWASIRERLRQPKLKKGRKPRRRGTIGKECSDRCSTKKNG